MSATNNVEFFILQTINNSAFKAPIYSIKKMRTSFFFSRFITSTTRALSILVTQIDYTMRDNITFSTT